jgi:hypothetical protein
VGHEKRLKIDGRRPDWESLQNRLVYRLEKVRVLLINRFFGGQQTPTGRMLLDVAQELKRQGHEVEVLVSKSKYAGAQGVADSESREFKMAYVRELGGGRLFHWTGFWLRAAGKLASRRWDSCVLLTDPPFLPFAAWLTRIFRTRRQRIFWWTMDIYPEALVSAGMLQEPGWPCRCLRRLNELGLSQISGVVTLGRRQQQRLQTYRRWNPAADFSTVVAPWDNRPIDRVDVAANRLLNRLALSGKKVALYSGNLGEGHLFLPFVAAARWLHEQGRKDWQLVFVVRGAGRHELAVRAAGLPNVTVLDYLPAAETPDLLWSATVHLISMKPGWEGVIVPSKLYGTVQTNAPALFLGPLDADTAVAIEGAGRGLSLPPTATGEEVVRTLDELATPAWRRNPQSDTTGPGRVAAFITRV